MSIAVIKTGGKQYVVSPHQKLKVEKLTKKDGEAIAFETLLVASEDGKEVKLGQPALKEQVEAKVLKHDRADKITVIKYKRKVRYRRKVGHRQHYTEVQIGTI